jgi:prepilin-type N-terminal cleavage/methylation domain-containing protein
MNPGVRQRAFTLIEMLVVIAIIGILAAISLPVLSNFRGDNLAGGIRQMMGDVARARQLAISQRTTVYMVFCPIAGSWTNLPAATNLWDKQLNAYNFVALRSVGDQPGRRTVRYLARWKTLPEGVFIATNKFFQTTNQYTDYFDPPGSAQLQARVFGMNVTSGVPFPEETSAITAGIGIPYIAFNHLGQLIYRQGGVEEPLGRDEYIPLARGSVSPALNIDKHPRPDAPSFRETPPGNSFNAFTLIHIDALTGRASVEQPQIQ